LTRLLCEIDESDSCLQITNEKEATREMGALGSIRQDRTNAGKALHLNLKVEDIVLELRTFSSRKCLLGETLPWMEEVSTVVLNPPAPSHGTQKQIEKLILKLNQYPSLIPSLVLSEKLWNTSLKNFSLRFRSQSLLSGNEPSHGILNVTPDSFRWDSILTRRSHCRGWRMMEEGADLIDIGGESTRPGSSPLL